MAATVCANEPRTHQQRRSAAAGAIGRGEATLACHCGSEHCPAAAERKALGGVVIHVLAERTTLEGTSEQPGYLPGFGILPAESVRELAATATLKPLAIPSGPPEPGYRPSPRLAEFVWWRDLTCRWPGCDRPAQRTPCPTRAGPPTPRVSSITPAPITYSRCAVRRVFSEWG